MLYSHSYIDPETGESVDVMIDDSEAEAYRNAGPREHRGTGRPSRGPFGGHQHGGGLTRPAPRPRDPANTTVIARPRPPVVARPTIGQSMAHDDGEYFAIKKSAIAELLPAVGQIWASFLAPPAPPAAVGNDIVDRDNAAMHRQALAMHDQNQTRILALTNLAARAAKLFL